MQPTVLSYQRSEFKLKRDLMIKPAGNSITQLQYFIRLTQCLFHKQYDKGDQTLTSLKGQKSTGYTIPSFFNGLKSLGLNQTVRYRKVLNVID